MATVIVMPRLSPTMEEGVLRKWLKKEGERVNPGDVIAEVETDKANMDFPFEEEGTLLKLLAREGETVKLGAPVAVIGEPGEDMPDVARAAADTSAPEERPAPTPSPSTPATTTPSPATLPDRPRSSPLARKLAAERGIDLGWVAGSGPGGRVVLRDIEVAAAPPREHAAAPPPGEKTLPLTPMRRTIARRLVEAKVTVPHFYVTMDVRADALAEFHRQVKEATETKISLNDLVVKALAMALRRVPNANASFTEAGIIHHGRVDIGVAVSIEDGLVTPVVRNADQKSLSRIAGETRDLIERARARRLAPEEFTGGTFSVSNMGMYGVTSFSAIINPPEGGILAVGALEKRPVVVTRPDGREALAIGHQMTLTLSCDHRVIDGALGAKLLGEVVRVLERPLAMVL